MWPALTILACLGLGGLHWWWKRRYDEVRERLVEQTARSASLQEQQQIALGQAEVQQQALFNSMVEGVLLLDGDDHPLGWLWRQDVERPGPVGADRATSPDPLLEPDSTLRDALSAMLGSAVQEGVVVDPDGRLLGTLTVDAVSSVLRQEAPLRA